MTLASLQRALRDASLISLDTSVVIAANDATDPRHACASWIYGAIGEGRFRCVLSTMTAAELLVGAGRSGPVASLVVQADLRRNPNLQLEPFTLDIAVEAARVRLETRLPLPDAAVLATALVTECEVLVHADRKWSSAARKSVLPLRLAYLGDHCP